VSAEYKPLGDHGRLNEQMRIAVTLNRPVAVRCSGINSSGAGI
jgi:hypothetical protein